MVPPSLTIRDDPSTTADLSSDGKRASPNYSSVVHAGLSICTHSYADVSGASPSHPRTARGRGVDGSTQAALSQHFHEQDRDGPF